LAQSHIKITGGLLDGKSMRNTISIIGHTFEAGQALRFNREAGTGVPGDFYAPAIADSAANSEVIGVVESVEGSSFVLVYGGEISTANFDGKFALVDDDVFFLSGTTPGLVENIPPSTAGQVIKPVLVRSDGNRAIVTNFIGTVIGGSSVVNLDGIQPVGTIEPYAGQANDVPTTWSLCDGGALSTTEFIDLYNRIGREFGFHQTIQSSAITPSAGIAVGQVVQQGGGLTGRIVSIDFALNQITVDVDYLRSTGTIDGFTPHNETFSGSNLTIPNSISGTEGIIYAGSLTPLGDPAQPSTTITLSSATVTITAFRKPDLRGKVVMGSALKDKDPQEGTLIVTDRNSPRGSILGEYEHTLTEAQLPQHSHTTISTSRDLRGFFDPGTHVPSVDGDIFTAEEGDHREGSDSDNGVRYHFDGRHSHTTDGGSGQGAAHNNLQPTVAINWIIKTTANAAAAVIDNLTTQIPLTDLTDVDITPSDGDIVMYDASNTPVKFKAYNLLTNYKPNAEQIFQIDTSGTNPKVRFGGPTPASANGFSVNLDGLGLGASKFEILNGTDDPLMSLQKTTATDQTYGIASIGTNGPPQESANLSLGNKGLLFTESASTPVNKIVTTVAPLGTATDTNLVTEKAVRDAIDGGSSETYFMALTHHGDAILGSVAADGEVFPSWCTSREDNNGVKWEVTKQQVSPDSSPVTTQGKLRVTNNSGSDIVINGTFSYIGQRRSFTAAAGDIEEIKEVGIFETVISTGTSNDFLTPGIGKQGSTSNDATFKGFNGLLSFRKATAAETAQDIGKGAQSFTP
tara:strand:- start:5149 stop:7548 length:2400 start_codon:yes stop_codon:yes gene_type:complete